MRETTIDRGRRLLLAVLLVLGLVVGAGVLWIVGVVGIGQYGEDICLDRLSASAGAVRADGSVLPPRLTCIYHTADGARLRVEHPVYAAVRSAWLVGYPVVVIAGTAVVLVRRQRRQRRSPA